MSFSRIAKLGILLAIASVLPWLLLLVLSFLPLSLTERVIPVPGGFANAAAGLLVLAEVMFGVGAVLAGHEVVRRFRQKLNPKTLCKRMGNRIRRLWSDR